MKPLYLVAIVVALALAFVAPVGKVQAQAVPVTLWATASPCPCTPMPFYQTSQPVTPTPSPSPGPTPTPRVTTVPVTPTPSPSPGPTPTPTQVLLPGTPPPMHVATVAYLTSAAEVATNPRILAPYLTYAYGKTDHLAALQAAGIKTISYTNPLQPLIQPSPIPCVGQGDCPAYTLLSTTYASVAAKDATGATITGSYGSAKLPALFADQRTPQASQYLQAVEDQSLAYVASANGGKAASDLRFVDNASPTLYNPSASPAPSVSPAAWDAAIASALGKTTDGPYIVNSLSSSTIAGVQAALNTLNAPNVVGGEFEECYGGNTGGNQVAAAGATYNWLVGEYAEIQTLALGKQFWCYQRMSGDGATWIPQRLYTYASFLLTNDGLGNASKGVYGTALSGGTTYGGPTLFPEMQLVPVNPTKTASDVSGYLTASGAYARAFGSCLYQGVNLGPCAVCVNPSPKATVACPSGYTRAVSIAGDGVFDGGTLSIVASSLTLPPTSAEIMLL